MGPHRGTTVTTVHYAGRRKPQQAPGRLTLRTPSASVRLCPLRPVPPHLTARRGMAEQYIFTIENLSKAYNKREVLKNIWLAFYPGAKIGVIGSNGAGKSTLLRVMARQETDFLGTARLTDGFSVGFVPQEPQLTPNKTVRENVEEAVAGTRALLARQEEIGNKMAE